MNSKKKISIECPNMIGRLPVLQEYELCFDISMIFQTMIVTNTVARSIIITRVALV
jgi:hypothetical protein